MPKKANRRPTKGKPRSRPPAPRSNGATPVLEQNGAVENAVADAPMPATTTVAARPAAARPAAPRRAAPVARKSPTLTINYDYLRHDLIRLLVLALIMIVLVVASYFLFH